MIGAVLATLMTVNTHNGTINYLFRKPQNGPNFIKETIAPEQETFSVYMISKTLVQNLNIEITVSNAKTNMVSLLYASTNGVAFEFVRFQVVCDKCNRLSFAPVLRTPMVGMFWCVVNITKMQYMYVPEMTVLKGNYFYVDEFLLEKGRFHTVIDNHVFASSTVQTVRYGSIGSHVDRDYVSDSTERCLSCNDPAFRLDSQCSCGQNGLFKGGKCYKQINVTELLSPGENSTVRYFLKCLEARTSIIYINYTLTEQQAIEYRTVLNIDCDMSNVVFKGQITVNQTQAYKNSLFGISHTMDYPLEEINISLDITQVNDGMGVSALLFYQLGEYNMITRTRITGSLTSQGQSAGDGFAIIAITYVSSGSISEIGIFGVKLNVTGDRVGILYSTSPADGWAYLRSVYIAPYMPEEYRTISMQSPDEMQLTNTDFTCLGYSNQINLNCLKFASYYDILATIGGEIIETQIIVRGGGNNIGGLYGELLSTGGCQTTNSAFRLVVDNQDQGAAKSCVGLLIGAARGKVQSENVYAEGQVNSNSKYAGILGDVSFPQSDEMIYQLAVVAKIGASEHAGFVGRLDGANMMLSLSLLMNLEIACSAKVGVFGQLSNINISQQIIGQITFVDGLDRYAGQCGTGVMVNGRTLEPGDNVKNVVGCYANTCAGDESQLQQINMTDLIATTIDSLPAFYAAECVQSARITVNVTKQLSGRKIVQILASDSCSPNNIQIQGALTIDTQEVGTTELRIAGLVMHQTASLMYFNTSLDIKHIGLNGTKSASLFAYDYQTHLNVEFVRITGTILADSKSDIPAGSYAAFMYCFAPTSLELRLLNVGLYGAQINFTGAEAVGTLAKLDKGAFVILTGLIITRLSNDPKLLTQFSEDRYYYYKDACANKLSNDRNASLNYAQYQDYFVEGRPTAIYITYRKAKNIGVVIGWMGAEDYYQSSLQIEAASIAANVYVQTTTYCTGILIGFQQGQLQAQRLYAIGELTAKHQVGLVGLMAQYSYLVAACRLNITGSSELGTIGRAEAVNSPISVFFDNYIKYDEIKVGGLIGALINSPWFTAHNIIGRCILDGNGTSSGLIVGYTDDVSASDFYQNAVVNQC